MRKEEVRNINSVAFEAVGLSKRSTNALKIGSSGLGISSPVHRREIAESSDSNSSSSASTPIGSPSAGGSSSSTPTPRGESLGLSSSLSMSGNVPLKTDARGAGVAATPFQRRITFNDLMMFAKFEMGAAQCNASFLYKILHGKDIIMR